MHRRLMLGISLLSLDLRSGGTMSAEMHLQLINTQEPERIGICSALLQDLQSSPSLDARIAEIIFTNKRPWDLMSWVKQHKLPAVEAI